jgi:uncharacterized protein (TIGR02646 family)
VRPGVNVPATALAALAELQARVDAAGDYPERVAEAKARWASVRKDASPFAEVRDALHAMCWGARRCCYCEDSVADEIEHFRPKDLYPEEVFRWLNYLYACGPCNGPKNHAFAVFQPGAEVETVVTRPHGAAVVAPDAGTDALLHPRVDDPLHYLVLDIVETFCFGPRQGASTQERARALYTIKVLHLNIRTYLVEARRTAYAQLVCALEAASARRARDPTDTLTFPKRAVELTSHRCVWEEMKRQRNRLPALGVLFETVPEAWDW